MRDLADRGQVETVLNSFSVEAIQVVAVPDNLVLGETLLRQECELSPKVGDGGDQAAA